MIMAKVPENPFTVCLLQPPLRREDQTPLEATNETIALMRRALEENDNIRLFVLPELCPVGYSEDTFQRFVPTTPKHRTVLQEQIDAPLRQTAMSMKVAICYGTMGWSEDKQQSTIRQIAVTKNGESLAIYDKIHLCDYGDCQETRFFTPGNELCSFILEDGWSFGLIICADMRYPFLLQNLVQHHGIHAILQPASFARDCSFRTWKSFRETRAVETGTYFLANNYAGDYFGQTSMNPPWIDNDTQTPIVLGTEVSYIITTLDPQVLKQARTEYPFYHHTMTSKSCPICKLTRRKADSSESSS